MYLQRIELQGFKSFAQKVVLEFPTPGQGCKISPNLSARSNQLPRGLCGITAVVGPNGSGKSNIVDAVRWVLGEQSLKLLRGKKSTDIIFSGSAKKSQLSMAEASIYLNNEDRSAPIDYLEIVITRRLYRDGTSEYWLNKNQVRLFDVIILLAKANFGQNTYSIIGQGMVDRIVNYSPQERKNFFDEATGVRQFQIKRERSVNKLNRSHDNLIQVKNLLEELEPRLRSLTRQVNRLRRRQEVEVELRKWQIKYYSKLWLDLDVDYQRLAADFTVEEKQKIKLNEQLEGWRRQLADLSQAQGRSEEFNRLRQNYDQEINKRDDLLKRLAEIKGLLQVEYLKIGRTDWGWLENRRDDLKVQLKEIENELPILDQQLAREEKILEEKIEKQKRFLSEFKDLENRLLNLQKDFYSDLGVSEKEIRQMVNRLYSLQKDFCAQLETAIDLKSLDKIKNEAAIIFAEVENFYRKISQQEKRQQSSEMVDQQKKLSEFIKTKDLLVNELNEVRVKLESLNFKRRGLLDKKTEYEKEIKQVEVDLAKNQQNITSKNFPEKLKSDRRQIENQLQSLDKSLKSIKNQLDCFNEEQEIKKREIFSIQEKINELQNNLNQITVKLNEIKIELTRIETKKEDLFVTIRQDLGADYRPKIDSQLKSFNPIEALDKISKFKKQIELIGGTDPEVSTEYDQVKSRYDFLRQQSDDLEKAISDLEKIINELDKIIKKQFESEFKKINRDFSHYFKLLFDGGSAKLILTQKELTEAEAAQQEVDASNIEESDNILDEAPRSILKVKNNLAADGIDIEACPAGKKIKNISMLSGGEKTMTALALICAIISNNPSPFILFDEVDAALDEANSIKFGDIIGELSHKTQFIIITHNRSVMARADMLYGVTMQGDGVSRLISLKLNEAERINQV